MARRSASLVSLIVLVVFALMIFLPVAALASSKGRRNTALALTAGALYGVLRKNRTIAIASGAGAAYAWYRYTKGRAQENYKRGYNDGRSHARYYGNNGKRYGYYNSKGKWVRTR